MDFHTQPAWRRLRCSIVQGRDDSLGIVQVALDTPDSTRDEVDEHVLQAINRRRVEAERTGAPRRQVLRLDHEELIEVNVRLLVHLTCG